MNTENNSEENAPEIEPGKNFKRLEDTMKKAFDDAGRKARETAPRVKEVLDGALVDLAYGIAYGAGFATSFGKEFVPASVKESLAKGMRAGENAGHQAGGRVKEAVDKRLNLDDPSTEEAIPA